MDDHYTVDEAFADPQKHRYVEDTLADRCAVWIGPGRSRRCGEGRMAHLSDSELVRETARAVGERDAIMHRILQLLESIDERLATFFGQRP
jgi:hypothetical protein